MTDITALLGKSGVKAALIVDDAFDEVPRAADLLPDAEEWEHFFADLTEDDKKVLRELFPKYDAVRADELQADDAFVAAIWGGKGLRKELIDPLLKRYRSASETDLEYLSTLRANLERVGLTCATSGRNFEEAAATPEIVFIDLFLGSGQRPDDIEIAMKGLERVVAKRQSTPPLVVLMSRSSRLEEKREEFRDKCGLFASAFRIIAKEDLKDASKFNRLLSRLSAHASDSTKLAAFADAWRKGLDAARDQTTHLIRKLELADLAQVQQLLLSAEGQPTGSYLVDVFDAVFRHEIERDERIIQGAIALNALTSDAYPPPYVEGSPDLQDLVYRSMFQNRKRLSLAGSVGGRIAFGDILMRSGAAPAANGVAGAGAEPPKPGGIDHSQVLLTVTPACDLQRVEGGAKNIMFMIGNLKPLKPTDWKYNDDTVRTPVIELSDKSRHWIKWDLKSIVTFFPGDVAKWLDDPNGLQVIGRLREAHALELQQKMLSSLGRVGLTALMPATFPLKVAVLLPDAARKLMRVPMESLGKTGVCYVGRDGNKELMKLVLTEDQCDEIADSISAFDEKKLHPNAKEAVDYLRKSADLAVALERGITLPGTTQTNLKEIMSPTGALIGTKVRAIGWVARNINVDEHTMSLAEIPKAGIVIATWDPDRSA